MTSMALGKLDSTMWVHLTTGSSDVIGAVAVPVDEQEEFLLDEIPAIPGASQWQAYPVLSYLRTARTWRPGVLTSHQRQGLIDSCPQAPELKLGFEIDLDSHDAAILKVLKEDGRQSYDELARQVGTSVATVRRRLDRLRCEGKLQIRAAIAPCHLGLGTEIVMWLRVRDSDIEAATQALIGDDTIKYAVRIAGEWTFVLNSMSSTVGSSMNSWGRGHGRDTSSPAACRWSSQLRNATTPRAPEGPAHTRMVLRAHKESSSGREEYPRRKRAP